LKKSVLIVSRGFAQQQIETLTQEPAKQGLIFNRQNDGYAVRQEKS